MSDVIDRDGFRANVGIVLMGGTGKLFLGRRTGGKGWQFPQGGMRRGESAEESLFRELEADPGALKREGIQGLYRIGDCVSPRLIADAIFDGHRLAREIDSADPAVPLPYIREYRVLGRSDAEFDAVLDGKKVEARSSRTKVSVSK